MSRCWPPTTARSSCASWPTSVGDVHLKEAFERRADIHRETAARVLHKDPADVNSDERSMAKMVNFGLAYGMSDFGLASRAGIPRQAAQEFISSYFAAYSRHQLLHDAHQGDRREQGYVATLYGRRRWIPELAGAQLVAARRRRADGHQHAHPGHGRGHHQDRHDPPVGAADELRQSRARMLLQVHDELLLEVPRSDLNETAPSSSVTRWRTPSSSTCHSTVDVKSGADWESMTPLALDLTACRSYQR